MRALRGSKALEEKATENSKKKLFEPDVQDKDGPWIVSMVVNPFRGFCEILMMRNKKISTARDFPKWS